ncbi:MAG TPA: DUF4432 family protein [Gaiellales bacterium]|nr:DUF4432 family protein [Gaiellales bacterium]
MSLVETATLSDGDLSVDVIPSRGLDLGTARLAGRRFSWESPIGFVPWQGDFSRSFGGGLLVTCGLRNVGAPSEGHPLHGWYSSLPARDVEIERSVARGRVVDASVPGPTLELTREIRVEAGVIAVTDIVRNAGTSHEPAPLLYHVNLLWDSVQSDAREVVPRDDDARDGGWRERGPIGPERVYEHIGAAGAEVLFGDIEVHVQSSLPRLWQWIEPSYDALGIEPANCGVRGRAHDREEGRQPTLAPGEGRTSTLEIRVRERART